MTDSDPVPDPLQNFAQLGDQLAVDLREIDAMLADYAARQRQGKILPNLVEAIRIELTYNSNAIEGSTLTLRQTQLIIEGTVPSGVASMRELYEARNHDRALRMIEKCAAENRGSLAEADLLQIHAAVMADIASYAGQFRSDRVMIAGSGFIPPDTRKFDVLVPAMLRQASRSDVHPLLIAAELHYNFVAIHPFNDGNGRTARLLMDYDLLRHGFPHIMIAVAERAAYLDALDEANHGRVQAFGMFIIKCAKQSMRRYL